jgi:signal transduction histidine kinase
LEENRNTNLRISKYWRNKIVLPIVAISILFFVISVLLIYQNHSTQELRIMNNVGKTLATLVSDPIQFGDNLEIEKRISGISKDNLISTVIVNEENIPIASYPRQDNTAPINRNEYLSFNIKSVDGRILGTALIRKTDSLAFVDMYGYLICLLMLILAVSFTLIIRFIKPIIEDIEKLSIKDHSKNGQKHKFFEIQNVFEKISKQKADDIALETLSARLETAQMMAHDVRKPFSLIKIAVSRIQNSKTHKNNIEILSGLIPALNRSIATVDGMVSDLLESQKPPVTKLESNIDDIISQTILDFDEIIKKRGLSVVFASKATLIAIADPLKIQRTVTNLLKNAIEAAPNKSTIYLESGSHNGQTYYSILNSGQHISEDHLDQIFKPFFTSGKKDGTGLGLSIVRKIAEQFDGSVSCQSTKETGTKFTVTLPSGQQTPKATYESAGFIAVIDDCIFVRESWEAILGDSIEVVTYKTPEDFLKEMNADSYRKNLVTVITDNDFGNLDTKYTGISFCNEFTMNFNHPIVLSSSGIFNRDEIKNFNAVIAKEPLKYSELCKLVQNSSLDEIVNH